MSMVMLIAFTLGAGVLPTLIGYGAERFSFASCFMGYGIFSLLLVPFFLSVKGLGEGHEDKSEP